MNPKKGYISKGYRRCKSPNTLHDTTSLGYTAEQCFGRSAPNPLFNLQFIYSTTSPPSTIKGCEPKEVLFGDFMWLPKGLL